MLTSITVPSQTQSIIWNDKILIAATEIMDLSSSQQSTSSQVPISPGQRVVLPSDAIELTSPTTSSDSSGSSSFVFENQRPASAILFREVNGQIVSFYVSAEGPNGAGESNLTPRGVCRLFFGPRVAVGSLSGGGYMSETVDVEVGDGKREVKAVFGREGKWSVE